jgi:hypothetical protein
MRSRRKFIKPERSNVGPRGILNDAPFGYEHLLGTHAASGRACPQLLLGLTMEDIRAWKPEDKPRKTRTTRKKKEEKEE